LKKSNNEQQLESSRHIEMQRQWKIRTALDCAVDFNEHVNAFITGRACTLSSDVKGRHRAEMRAWA